MKTQEQAVRNYEKGLSDFGGADVYMRCADAGGWYDVAKCLHDAKARALTTGNMVERYARSA